MKHWLWIIAISLSALPGAACAQPGTATPAITTLFGDKDGNYGIGTAHPASAMDVFHKGEVRVGNSGQPCTAANQGAIRYAKAHLQFCDGHAWRTLAVVKDDAP